MKICCVLITFNGIPSLGPSLPVNPPFLDGDVEGISGKISKEPFQARKRSRLLDEVKKVDEDTSILLTLGKGSGPLGPRFAGRAEPTEPSNQSGGDVRPEGGMPGRDNGAAKPSMQGP
jgi:hypothetical protein